MLFLHSSSNDIVISSVASLLSTSATEYEHTYAEFCTLNVQNVIDNLFSSPN